MKPTLFLLALGFAVAAASSGEPAFPLKVSDNPTHLVDSGEWNKGDSATAAVGHLKSEIPNLKLAKPPGAGRLTVNRGMFPGLITADWFDSTCGGFTAVEGSPFANTGTRDFSPPARNAADEDDRVLLLAAESRTAVGNLKSEIPNFKLAKPLDAAALEESVRQLRMGTLVVEAPPGAEVRVEQLRHEFWFGAALANQAFNGRMRPEERSQYLAAFLTNFNAAVTENALKWHDMEPRRGTVNYATVEAILAWTGQHQLPLRGHNVFWGIANRVQPWLKEMDDDTLRAALKARALDIARRYRGRFAEYDLNNEMLHGNYYEQRLGPNITRDMAAWMRQEDSQAVLYLNDYDITTGRRVDDYAAQIRKFLEQGVPLGGIGVQGHLHGDTFDSVALQKSLDQLAEFKLPIRITEFNFPGQRSKYYGKRDARLTDEEEQAKAKALADYYLICFAHPAVEGILMWGFWEGANWIPGSSLYRRDWSATPAAAAYRDLVFKQWWTSLRGQADAQGRCEVRAFFGKHRVTAGGKMVVVELTKQEPIKRVSLKQP